MKEIIKVEILSNSSPIIINNNEVEKGKSTSLFVKKLVTIQLVKKLSNSSIQSNGWGNRKLYLKN